MLRYTYLGPEGATPATLPDVEGQRIRRLVDSSLVNFVDSRLISVCIHVICTHNYSDYNIISSLQKNSFSSVLTVITMKQ